MRPNFKEPHVAMKSCCPQAFLNYFALVEFISFGSRNAKAFKLFSIISYSGVHILCFFGVAATADIGKTTMFNNNNKQIATECGRMLTF